VFRDLFSSLFFALVFLWTYLSIRKYGWLDTLEYCGILPFLFIAATISALSKKEYSDKPDFNEFSTVANVAVDEAINEIYEGKIINSEVIRNMVQITVETPFGLRLPIQKLLPVIAEKLHIRQTDLTNSDITDHKSSYIFTEDAVRTYKAYSRGNNPEASFTAIKERFLLRAKKKVTRT
jgi:hypothetical protein